MHVCSDFSIIDSTDFHIRLDDRSFNYGDGLFETMISKNGQIRWLNDHWERLIKGCEVLRFTISTELTPATINLMTNELISKNGLSGPVRVKLKVWRVAGGLYTPEKNETHFLITVSPFSPNFRTIEKAGFSDHIHLPYSIYSSIKTCSSIPYILAGIEKKEKGLDELILTDYEGHISECSSSNIFWFQGNTAYTPSLSTGCMEGITRKNLMRFLDSSSVVVHEVRQKKEALWKSDSILTTNVAGVRFFSTMENKPLRTENELITSFIEAQF